MQVTFDSSAVHSRHTFPLAKLVRFIIGRTAFGSLPNACGFGVVCAMLRVPLVTWIAITLISRNLNLTHRSSCSPFFNRLPIWLAGFVYWITEFVIPLRAARGRES
jgi:hypothetical protein